MLLSYSLLLSVYFFLLLCFFLCYLLLMPYFSPRFCPFFLHSWLFFFSLLCFFEKKQRNESLLVALFSSLYYVCSEGEGGGATGDEVGAPVLAGQCASLFLSLQSSLSRFPWFCFCLPLTCGLSFSSFYSQRTMLFHPLIAGVMVVAGG